MRRTLTHAARATALAALLVAETTAAAAQPYQAFPVDEASQDASLAALRDQLRDAVHRHDLEAVVALAQPDIHLSYGGDFGRETLRQWLAGAPDMPWTGTVYWQALTDALDLGGSFMTFEGDRGAVFCAPYTFLADIPAELGPFDAVLVVRGDASLRDGPGSDHAAIATLDHSIAEILYDESGFDPDNPNAPYWLHIRTADGSHEGYVSSDDVRSPIDYRACFSQDTETGDWVWDQFIAGD